MLNDIVKLSDEEILAPEPVIVASTLTMNSLNPTLPWVKSKSYDDKLTWVIAVLFAEAPQ